MMKMDDLPTMAAPAAAAASPEIFQQLGTLTRQLHDTLNQLGVLPKLTDSVNNLPDARSRLSYIATKTAAAAEKVLNLVDEAKADQAHIVAETRKLAQLLVADPVKAVASGGVMNFVEDVEAATIRIDRHLTEIMLAQDFHDLTGQVVARVVQLAADIEDQLVRLLLQTAPTDQVHKVEQSFLNGPVVNPEGRADVVTNQEQVDDLLASLGF